MRGGMRQWNSVVRTGSLKRCCSNNRPLIKSNTSWLVLAPKCTQRDRFDMTGWRPTYFDLRSLCSVSISALRLRSATFILKPQKLDWFTTNLDKFRTIHLIMINFSYRYTVRGHFGPISIHQQNNIESNLIRLFNGLGLFKCTRLELFGNMLDKFLNSSFF